MILKLEVTCWKMMLQLLDDATDFSWSTAVVSHMVAGWQETEKIDRIRRAHTQSHGNQTLTGTSKRARVTHCWYLNKHFLFTKQMNETKGVLYKHICHNF